MPQPPPSPEEARRPPRRRLLRRAAFVLAALVALLLLAWLLREPVVHPLLARGARALLAGRGIELEVERLRSDWLTGARVEGLVLEAPEQGLARLAVREAEVAASPWGLLRRGLEGVERLRARGVELDLRQSEREPTEPGPRGPLPARLPELDLAGVDLSIELGGGLAVRIRGARLTGEQRPAGTLLALEAPEAELAGPAGGEPPAPLRAEAVWDAGALDVRDAALGDVVRILAGSTLDLRPEARGEDARTRFDARAEAFGGRLAAAGAVRDAETEVDATASGIRLGALARWIPLDLGPLADLEGVLADLRADLRVPAGDALALEGELSVTAADLRLGELALDRLRAEGRAGAGALTGGLLELERGANRVAASELSLPLERGLGPEDLERVAGRLSVEATDLPALLGAAPERTVPSHRLVLEGRAADGVLAIETGVLETDGGTLRVEEGRLAAVPGEDRALDWRVEAGLAADFHDLAPLGTLAGEVPWAGTLRGTTHVEGRWPELSARASLAGSGVVVHGTPVGTVGLTARLSGPLDRPGELAGRADLTLGPLEAVGRRIDQLEARLALDRGVLAVPDLELVQGPNRLAVRLERLPVEQSFPRALTGTRGSLSLSASDLPALLATEPPPDERVPPHQLDLSGRIGGGRVALDRGRLATPEGVLVVERGALELDPATGEPRAISAALRVDFDDLAPLGRILGSAGWAGSLAGGVAVAGTVAEPRGEADLAGEDVLVAGLALGDVEVRGSLDGEVLRVASLEAGAEGDRLTASGAWRLATGELEDVSFELSVANLARYAPEIFRAGSVEASGELEGDVLAPSGRLTLAGSVQPARALPIEVEEVELALAGEAGSYRIERARTTVEGATLRLAGALDWRPDAREASLELAELALERGPLDLALEAPATIEASPQRVAVSPLALSGSGGRLALAGELRADGDGAAKLSTSDCDVLAILRPAVPEGFAAGGLDVELLLSREAGALTLASAGDWGGLVPARGVAPLALSWDLRLADGELAVAELRVESSDLRLSLEGTAPLAPEASPPLADGPVDLRLDLAVRRLAAVSRALREDAWIEGEASARAALEGTWRDLRGRVEVDASEIHGRGALEVAALDAPGSIVAHLALDGGVSVERLELDLPGLLEGRASGRLGLEADLVRWLAGERPDPADVPVEASLDMVARDLAPLEELAPVIRRASGRLEVDATVEGTLAAPRPRGRFALSEGELKLAADVPSFAGVGAEIVWSEEAVTVERFAGELGGAPVALSGRVRLGPDGPVADALELRGQNLLLYRERGVLIRADADLAVSGPVDELLVSGRVALQNSRFTQDFDLLGLARGERPPAAPQRGIQLFSWTSPVLSTLRFDVAVTSLQPIQVKNNVLDGGVRPDLALRGTGLVPHIEGRIYLDPTRVKLPATTVTVESGTVSFLREDPFVPLLALQATTRMRGYDITISISGPYDEPEIVMSSVPPLRSDDLLYLVATGKPPEKPLTQEAGQEAAQTVASFVAMDVFKGFVGGNGTGEESFVERFEFTTGRDVSKSGVETIEVTFRLAEDVLVERDAAYVAVERDVHEHFNLGFRMVFRFGGE